MPKSFDWEDAYHAGADLRGTADKAWSDPQITLEELIAALGGEICEGKVAAPGRGRAPNDRSLHVTPDPASPNGFCSNDPRYVLESLLVYRQRKSNGPSKASASPKKKSKAEGGRKNDTDDPASATAWRATLLFTHNGQPKAVLANAILALRKAPDWQAVLAFDEFALASMAMRPPPWTDRDDALATEWMQREGISVTVNTVATAAETVAKDRSFHPVRDYLRGLEWDGSLRLEKFASRYLGAPDTGYSTKVSKCMLIAGVARIMEPGCKSDHIVILEGKQGTGKSTALRLLFEPFFSDDLSELGTKDAQMQMNGIWCLEIAELTSMRKTEQERVKAFVSRSTDRFRPPYARRLIEAKRQCVLIGTTNSDQYLKDETGARFWPVRCGRINLDAIKQDRDQLWAEAVRLYDVSAVSAYGTNLVD
jgi:Virulence-associated protein E